MWSKTFKKKKKKERSLSTQTQTSPSGEPDYFHELAWDLLKDSGVTGHVPTSLQQKNMQSNKHVLIHTSKFKNTSVVLVSFIMWMTKCTRVDTVSELMSPHRWGRGESYEEGGGKGGWGGESGPLSKFMASSTGGLAWIRGQRGNVTVRPTGRSSVLQRAQNLWDDGTTSDKTSF